MARADVSTGPGANQEALRRHNLSRILRIVHRVGAISRAALTAETGLNRSTVGALVGELVERALVFEAKPESSGAPGRPSPVVRPSPRGVVGLAFDVEVDSLACAVVGVGGTVHARVRTSRARGRMAPEQSAEDLGALWDRVRHAAGERQIVGVGVAVVGLVRRDDGFVHLVPNLGWRDVPFAELLDARLGLGVPVSVANEADLGALAESVHGAGIGVADLVYLHGEVGVGAGVLSRGVPLSGADGYAGEVGHVPMNLDGLACHCGARGCWETELGEHAILRATGRDPDGGPGEVESLLEAARSGDARTLEGLHRIGFWLGTGMAALANLFNPRRVILGGLFSTLHPYTEASARAQLAARTLAPVADRLEVVLAELGDDAPLLGAAELALASVLEDPTLVRRGGPVHRAERATL